MTKKIATLIVLSILLAGCQTTLNETQTGALTGTALGAGLGAIIGNQTGHAGAGTALGAGAGALAGGLIGEGMRRNNTQQATPQYQQSVQPTQAVVSQVQTTHTKYNPRTGKTFPESFKYDPDDGTELLYLR